MNQGPHQTQELTLTLAFYFILGSTFTLKDVPNSAKE